MKKRMMALVLELAILGSLLLTACSTEKTSDTPDTTVATEQTENTDSKTETTDTAAEELEPVTLTWCYPGNYPQDDQETVFAALNEKIKEKINAEVNFVPISWGDYEQRMKLADAGGESYDICFTSDWSNNYVQNVSKGAYMELDELLKEYAPKTYASIPEKFWNATKINGKIYGVINYQIAARSSLLTFNKELADKYGFDPQSMNGDIDNVKAYLDQLVENEPNVTPIMNSWGDTYDFYFGLEMVSGDRVPGAVYLNSDSDKIEIVNQFKTQEFIDYAAKQAEWEKAGYLHGEDMVTQSDMTPLISEGKVAVWVGGTYKPGVETETAATYGMPVYCVQMSDAYATTTGTTATMQAISRTCKNPERAMMLLELMNTDKELYNMLAFGIEGVHYNKLDGDYIQPIADSGYSPNTLWLHASTFNAYLLEGQDADVWEQTKELNNSAKESPLMGFSFNPDPVTTEIAQCTSVISRYLPLFQFGIGDIENDYEEFIDNLDKAGAQTIIDEMQKQVDEWLATK